MKTENCQQGKWVRFYVSKEEVKKMWDDGRPAYWVEENEEGEPTPKCAGYPRCICWKLAR